MGASSSKAEDVNKSLQLCRERKKFVKQALNGRCSLAASHVNYIQSLKNVGIVLRKFVEAETPLESSLYPSTTATPEPLVFNEKSPSHFSSSPTPSHHVDATEVFSPSSSPLSSTRIKAHHMRYGASSSKKVEQKPFLPVMGTLSMSSSTQPQASHEETSTVTPSWDYFDINDLKDVDEDGRRPNKERHNSDASLRKHDGCDLEVQNDSNSYFHESEDDNSGSPVGGRQTRDIERKSPILSPSHIALAHRSDSRRTPLQMEDGNGNNIAHKDLLSGVKEIETLFIKAADCGKEVPRMLEANKFNFCPVVSGKDGDFLSLIRKACFSCGEDPSRVQEEPTPNFVKYLTWHRTPSSHSSSSRNPLPSNSKDVVDGLDGDVFGKFGMISGSHASTLDRLYAWEKKLRDEVKASEAIRSAYDRKCRTLREQESKGENSKEIDKTRTVVKDLHWRIIVAILRIYDISKKIEELRDKELHPQLAELINGLSEMWEEMRDCHKIQYEIISTVQSGIGNSKILVESEAHRHMIARLESELTSLSSNFTKWISAQKSYLQSINKWLLKCISLPRNSSRRKRRSEESDWSRWMKFGPPICLTCATWLHKLEQLPAKAVSDSIKGLVTEIGHLLSKHENRANRVDPDADTLANGTPDELKMGGLEGFRSSLVGFIGQLSGFAEESARLYGLVKEERERAEKNYEFWKSYVEGLKAQAKNPYSTKTAEDVKMQGHQAKNSSSTEDSRAEEDEKVQGTISP